MLSRHKQQWVAGHFYIEDRSLVAFVVLELFYIVVIGEESGELMSTYYTVYRMSTTQGLCCNKQEGKYGLGGR